MDVRETPQKERKQFAEESGVHPSMVNWVAYKVETEEPVKYFAAELPALEFAGV